jgi:hypothetical protein
VPAQSGFEPIGANFDEVSNQVLILEEAQRPSGHPDDREMKAGATDFPDQTMAGRRNVADCHLTIFPY